MLLEGTDKTFRRTKWSLDLLGSLNKGALNGLHGGRLYGRPHFTLMAIAYLTIHFKFVCS